MKKLLLLTTIVLGLISCKKDEEVFYEYEVIGTSQFYAISMKNKDGNIQQYSNAPNNWRYTWWQKGKKELMISATNLDGYGSGNVTVRIKRDGYVISQSTSYGGYVTATASGKM